MTDDRSPIADHRSPRRFGASLYVLLTQAVAGRALGEVARAVLGGGADALQLREKDLPDRRLIVLGRELRRLTEEYDALLFVNDRPDIAWLVGADGVHVGQDDLPPAAAREAVGPGRLVGVSTHSVEQAVAAAGADYIGVGPMFPTATKGYEEGMGSDLIRAVRAQVGAPIVAIGGITVETLGPVLAAGADCVAVCSAVIAAEDVRRAAAKFRMAIDAIVGGRRARRPAQAPSERSGQR